MNILTASAGSPATGIGLASSVIFDDAYTNVTPFNVDVTYTITPVSAAGCAGSTFTVTLTVRPESVVENQEVTVCSDVALGLNLGNDINTPLATTYNITNITHANLIASAGSPATGNGLLYTVIADDAWTNVTNTVQYAVYTVVPVEINGCQGNPFTVTATVNNEPLGTNTTTANQCSHIAFSFNPQTYITNSTTSTFSWTAVYPGSLTGGAGSGTGAISETLTNLTSGTLTAVYTLTPTSTGTLCTGNTFTVSVPVTPQPVVANQTGTICSDVANGITLSAGASIPATTFNITAINMNGLTASAGSPTIGNGLLPNVISNDAYTNTTSANVDVVYTITPVSAAGCTGGTFTVTVTVKPEPVGVATPSSQTLCSDAALTTIVLSNSNTLSGTTYAWIRNNTSNVTGIAASGNGDISGSLNNVTGTSQTVTFTITPTTDGCAGNTFIATITVSPEPVGVATPSTQTVCSRTAITPIVLSTSNSLAGTTYAWVRDNTTNVTGLANSGNGNISGTPVNTTGSQQTVTYTPVR